MFGLTSSCHCSPFDSVTIIAVDVVHRCAPVHVRARPVLATSGIYLVRGTYLDDSFNLFLL